jgi:hypothetical protein
VNQPISQHSGVALCESRDRSEVGLKATGEEQHLVSSEPFAQFLLQAGVPWPRPCDQARPTCANAIDIKGEGRGFNDRWMTREAEIVVASQIPEALSTSAAALEFPWLIPRPPAAQRPASA